MSALVSKKSADEEAEQNAIYERTIQHIIFFSAGSSGPSNGELREDGTFELREDGTFELRE